MPAIRFEGNTTRHVTISGNVLAHQSQCVLIEGSVHGLALVGNRMAGSGVEVGDVAFTGTIEGNDIHPEFNAPGISITADIEGGVLIDGNNIWLGRQHGIVVDDGGSATGFNDCVISNNLIRYPGRQTTNTYDGIHVGGAASRNYIHGNKIIPASSGNLTRYGINMAGSGDCNRVVGNDLGDPGDYGTDALNPGTGNELFWPADGFYGDNFTVCGS